MKTLLLLSFFLSTLGYSQGTFNPPPACVLQAVNSTQRTQFSQFGFVPGFTTGCLVVQQDTGVVYEWDGSQYNVVGPGLQGIVSLANGGTNHALTAINGGIVWSDASKLNLISAGTSGQVLTSGGAGSPTWSTVMSSAITSLNGQTGATQVFANDTNIIITSSGNTHSLSWGGTLSLARGGSGAALTAANGGIVYSGASALAVLGAGTSGQVLTSGGASAPTWSAVSTSAHCSMALSPTTSVYGSSGGNNVRVFGGIFQWNDCASAEVTYTQNASLGDYFIINVAGSYTMDYVEDGSGNPTSCVTLNSGPSDPNGGSGNLNTGCASMPGTVSLAYMQSPAAGQPYTQSVTRYLNIADRIRLQSSADLYSQNITHFVITKN